VFQRNQAARGVSRAQAEQAGRAVEALERTIRAEVVVAVERHRSAVAAAQAFAGTPVAENLELMNEAYRAGKVNLFELLVMRREALEARTAYLDALEELAASQAELTRVAGSIR
jgi:cobalt-zinc-cadmium efflux system outer membrane protein